MAQLCEMCGMVWCGRPCINDPHKSNALLFKRDGTPKTLKERGLGWDDPPLTPAAPPPRKKPTMVLLKELEKRGVTKKPLAVTEKPLSVTEIKPAVTEKTGTVTEKRRGRRPHGETALSAAERQRRWRERQNPKK